MSEKTLYHLGITIKGTIHCLHSGGTARCGAEVKLTPVEDGEREKISCKSCIKELNRYGNATKRGV